jgi:hypothetical protein
MPKRPPDNGPCWIVFTAGGIRFRLLYKNERLARSAHGNGRRTTVEQAKRVHPSAGKGKAG